MTHPAERIRTVPTTNRDNKKKFGLPSVSTIKAERVGQRRSNVPIGLSALISLKNPDILSLCFIHIYKVIKKHITLVKVSTKVELE